MFKLCCEVLVLQLAAMPPVGGQQPRRGDFQ